jgi:hypothetical protein
MAKMTGNGPLHGKQILDFIKEPVLHRSIFRIGSPNPPTRNEVLQTHDNILTPTVSAMFATHILPQKSHHSYQYHYNTNAKLMTIPQECI